jgi:hypothetical protein
MPARRGQPPPAREMPLPARPPERPDGNGILEPCSAALRQADTTAAGSAGELQLDALAPWLRSKVRTHASGPGGHASVHSASGFPASIQHMMSKTRSRER